MKQPASDKAKCHAMLTPTKRDLIFQLYQTLRHSDHVMLQGNITKHLKIINKKGKD